MKLLDAAAACGLVGLLSWLLLLSLSPYTAPGRGALAALEGYSASENALHRDLLSARSGLLNNYDPLDADVDMMRRMLDNVKQASRLARDPASLRALEGHFRQQRESTERFKSENALVLNSLAYFALFSERISGGEKNLPVRQSVERLSTAMLQLNLQPSPSSEDAVRMRLLDLKILCRHVRCGRDAIGIQAHAGLLARLLPEIDMLIRGQVSVSATISTAPIRMRLLEREGQAEEAAIRYRLLLYLVSLALVAVLVRWGLRIRAGSAVLRRQIALEHALSQLSMHMLAAPPGTLKMVLERGLGEIALPVGATHAYLLMPDRNAVWTWPASQARSSYYFLATDLHLSPSEEGILRLSVRDLALESPLRKILMEAQLVSCLCILPMRGAPSRNILAFGFPFECKPWPVEEQAILRAALDGASLAFEHEELSRERLRLAAELSQARRVETVGAFASGIAHNFNNLLGAISGNVEIAAGRALDCETRHNLTQIEISAERGKQLVQGLLSFVRRRDHQYRLIALDALVAETARLAQAAIGTEVQLVVTAEAGGGSVMVDPSQLQQVILNLCQNAAQAIGRGRIEIRTGRRTLTTPCDLSDVSLCEGDYVTVEVADRGPGIDAETLQRVFEPFFTTKATGTGLGLSTARDVLVEAGGALELLSECGTGTKANVWLPCYKEDDAAAEVAAQSGRDLLGAGEAVLYVAPNDQERLLGEDLLAALGYEPVGYAGGKEIRSIIKQSPDRFDAVLVDDRVLGDEVIGALREIRQLRPHLPRLLAVGSSRAHRSEALALTGITKIVSRPLNPAELATALRSALTREVTA
ncbi:DAHL domain-containing protein [Novosphingobium sp. AP12]|uniref:DAHL domain-containing protein n=1 Tax=Novosphingobium sp. AP12 TaxID=1144305 RepID=UPI000271F691|nr:DAHL domain-containing protein [Novosphingobium sp. AP12]EJL24280.1 signal transduction histidine kinase [Novosphingobium sp. AP12]